MCKLLQCCMRSCVELEILYQLHIEHCICTHVENETNKPIRNPLNQAKKTIFLTSKHLSMHPMVCSQMGSILLLEVMLHGLE